MFISEAMAQGASGGSGFLIQIAPLVLIFAVFYFLLIRPQQKKMKEHRAMVDALTKGDKVINNYEAFAWIVISGKNKVGKAKTATFPLPKKISNLLKEGYELGDADDMVFKRSNSKQKNGAVGILSDNLITRTDYYTHAIILALIPFTNSKLY